MAKADATGRSAKDRHVRLYGWLTSSVAWHSLSGNAIKLLIYIATFDNGANNGELFMSERHAADGIGVNRKTARKLLAELSDKGFIAQMTKGSFRTKRSPAAVWRLTFKPCPTLSQGPTNEWRQWQASKISRGQKLPLHGPIITHSPDDVAADGPEIGPPEETKPQKSAKQERGIIGPQIVTTAGSGSGDDPVTIMRTSIADWWRKSGKSDRLRLAKKNGLEIGELLGFVEGSRGLTFPKVVALHSSLRAAA